jgi:adenylate kinase family enzyme
MSWAIWITGRPGSGKTRLATRVAEALQTWPVTVKVLNLAATASRRAWRDAAREWIAHFAEVQLHRAATATVTPNERSLR